MGHSIVTTSQARAREIWHTQARRFERMSPGSGAIIRAHAEAGNTQAAGSAAFEVIARHHLKYLEHTGVAAKRFGGTRVFDIFPTRDPNFVATPSAHLRSVRPDVLSDSFDSPEFWTLEVEHPGKPALFMPVSHLHTTLACAGVYLSHSDVSLECSRIPSLELGMRLVNAAAPENALTPIITNDTSDLQELLTLRFLGYTPIAVSLDPKTEEADAPNIPLHYTLETLARHLWIATEAPQWMVKATALLGLQALKLENSDVYATLGLGLVAKLRIEREVFTMAHMYDLRKGGVLKHAWGLAQGLRSTPAGQKCFELFWAHYLKTLDEIFADSTDRGYRIFRERIKNIPSSKIDDIRMTPAKASWLDVTVIYPQPPVVKKDIYKN